MPRWLSSDAIASGLRWPLASLGPLANESPTESARLFRCSLDGRLEASVMRLQPRPDLLEIAEPFPLGRDRFSLGLNRFADVTIEAGKRSAERTVERAPH